MSEILDWTVDASQVWPLILGVAAFALIIIWVMAGDGEDF